MDKKNKELMKDTDLVKKDAAKISRRVAFKRIGQVSAAVAAVFLFGKQYDSCYYSNWYDYSDYYNWYNYAGKS